MSIVLVVMIVVVGAVVGPDAIVDIALREASCGVPVCNTAM